MCECAVVSSPSAAVLPKYCTLSLFEFENPHHSFFTMTRIGFPRMQFPRGWAGIPHPSDLLGVFSVSGECVRNLIPIWFCNYYLSPWVLHHRWNPALAEKSRIYLFFAWGYFVLWNERLESCWAALLGEATRRESSREMWDLAKVLFLHVILWSEPCCTTRAHPRVPVKIPMW